MSQKQPEKNAGNFTLDELKLLRNNHGEGIDICFQSNGRLIGFNELYATYTIGDGQYLIADGVYPLWVTELTAGRSDIACKHFRIKLSTAQVSAYAIEIIEECLDVLKHCDIYRDGGSYDAIWLTNYGARWELYLKASGAGVHAKDYTKRHIYLYRCTANNDGNHHPVLKKTEEEGLILTMLKDWLNKPFRQTQTNESVMELFSTFKGMYYSIPWRMY